MCRAYSRSETAALSLSHNVAIALDAAHRALGGKVWSSQNRPALHRQTSQRTDPPPIRSDCGSNLDRPSERAQMAVLLSPNAEAPQFAP